ncbi:hypothetical protein Bpfe_030881 [Biomphalaria pfeifferi]|uniref:Uncharacterized protein n=1 Tax=Biomphalaria pfeifferi TaxID=112525 RepID=A0AAD8ARR3_BIOPF|nr:hypothetical protein Bpfe_030881 [Biomphalaria pfeifferi]
MKSRTSRDLKQGNTSRSFKAKLQICLAYSCTKYQQMFDGFSGSSLYTMKMATLILTSKHSVANSTNLSSYPSNYYSLVICYQMITVFSLAFVPIKAFKAKGISYQQCTPMIYKSSLPSHSAKHCVHLSCIGSDPLYCTSMSGVWICQAKEIMFVSKVT